MSRMRCAHVHFSLREGMKQPPAKPKLLMSQSTCPMRSLNFLPTRDTAIQPGSQIPSFWQTCAHAQWLRTPYVSHSPATSCFTPMKYFHLLHELYNFELVMSWLFVDVKSVSLKFFPSINLDADRQNKYLETNSFCRLSPDRCFRHQQPPLTSDRHDVVTSPQS